MEFNRAEALALLKLFVETNTVNPPGNEAVLARTLQKLLLKEGIAAELDEFQPGRANLVARLPGKRRAPSLMLTGHLDTVPVGKVQWQHAPFACEQDGDLIYGRGIADMKGSDAAAIYALLLLKRSGFVPEQDILFVATAGEEIMSLGASRFVEQGGMEEAGALLVCEPSNRELITSHKGAVWLKICFYGKTAHGSMPDLGINAILHMNKFIEVLSRQHFQCQPDPELGMPSCSINTVQGGSATNVVPDYAECTLDFRTIPGQSYADIENYVKRALTLASSGEKSFKYSCELLGKVLQPVACPAGHRILDAMDNAAGRKLKRRAVNFFTDASVMAVKPGLPVFIYGPGDDKQAHQPDEHITLSAFYESIGVYYEFMKNYIV